MQALRICIQHQSQQSCLLQYHALSLTCKVLRSQLQILDCQSSGRLSPAQRPLRRGRPQRGVKPGVVQTPAQPEVVLDLPSVECRETFQKALVLQDWPQALQVFKQNTRDILATATPMALQSLVQGAKCLCKCCWSHPVPRWTHAYNCVQVSAVHNAQWMRWRCMMCASKPV